MVASRRRESAALGCMAALVLLKLWLVAWQAVGADGSARFDDALFVELAQHLRAGEWLGPYTERTLVKGPTYPMWLALTDAFGLPLLAAQHVLHALAALAIVLALRRMLPNPWARLALFAALIFDPATYEHTALRVTREGIYPALTMFILAGLIAIADRQRPRTGLLAVWGLGLGLAIGAFWLTREEGPWILPAAGIMLAYAAANVWRATRGRDRWRAVAIPVVPVAVAIVCVAGVAVANQRAYGVATVVEFKAGWFERAYGAVTRVAPEHYEKWVPLTGTSRRIAYEASPAFAELRPYLDGSGAADEFTLSRFGEMTGTWFIWAFREAAASAGHHQTLPDARAYYVRIADEIDAACATGEAPCGPPRASLAPPWRPEYFGAAVRAFGKLTHILLSMQQVKIEQFPSVGGPELVAPFREVSNMRIAGDDDPTRGVVRQEILRAVRNAYAVALYPATAIGLAGLIAGSVSAIRRRRLSPILVIAWAAVASAGARLVLLAYISASSYPIFHGIYLRVLYPLLLLCTALGIALAVEAYNRRSTN